MTGPTVTLEIIPVDGMYDVRLTTEFTVNLGDYNSKKFGGSYGGRFESKHSATEIGEHLGDKLYEMLTDEIVAAQALAPRKSYINDIVTN